MKANPCKLCQSVYHTAMSCPTKKRRPLRKEAVKTRQRRLSTAEAWFKANPQDENGEWTCYLQIHPWCPRQLTKETLVLEHVFSKVRRPDLKYDKGNLKPSCTFCNGVKMSKDVTEIR